VCVCVCVCVSHQGQQVEEEPGVLADEVVGLAAQVDEQLEAAGGTLAAVDDVRHVGGQDERGAVPDGEEGVKRVTQRLNLGTTGTTRNYKASTCFSGDARRL